MLKRTLALVVALVVALDGVVTAVWGKRYLGALRARLPFPVPPIAAAFMALPDDLLRGGAALQALIGAAWFRRIATG